MIKTIKSKKQKTCVICGKGINVIIYSNKSYHGGHYFGKIPLHTKKALYEALKAGYREAKVGNRVVRVMKKDPMVYKYIEYWECSKCYLKR